VPPIKGLLLDCYGTVVDEDDDIVSEICARAAACAAGTVTPGRIGTLWWEAFRAGMAATPFRRQRVLAVDSLATALTAAGCSADAAALCEDQFAFWRSAALQPGARAFLETVDVPICLLSNIDRADVEALLEHHGLRFSAVVTSEDAGAYKPSRRVFQQGLDALGLRADEVLHVGDSLTADVAGAQAAGIVPVWVNRRRRRPPDGREAVREITTLARLTELLAGRRGR